MQSLLHTSNNTVVRLPGYLLLTVFLCMPVPPLAAQTVARSDAFTVAVTTPNALQLPMPALSQPERAQFSRGRALFNQVWVAAPSLDADIDGLGPTYNQPSCVACHLRNGRGQPPAAEHERLRGALIRLSVPGSAANGGPLAHPLYGEQLNDNAITGVPAEGRALVRWIEQTDYFADGESVILRRPVVTFAAMAFGSAGDNLLFSLRVAPQIVGAGLLDAVPDASIEALAALPRPDGISGRVNRVFDPVSGNTAVGKFGWKASTASLTQQTAAAFHGDLGITSSNYPAENCPPVQTACAAAPFSTPDLTASQLEAVAFYQAALAVPAARDQRDSAILRGQQLFEQAGCQHCHIPQLETGATALVPALASQRFNAWTDMLLHDMGAALADGRSDHAADRSEWRTAPLWGIGLLPVVNEHQTLLHDGRARGVLEAIMWHGGEASQARARVRSMNRSDREALVAFVNAL